MLCIAFVTPNFQLNFISLDLQLEISECLGPPLSVYSGPLVIYSSPLVIYSCRLLDAFIKGLFKFFIHMTTYFFSLFKHLVTIISQQLSVLFLNMSFQPFFFFMQMVDYMFSHSLIFSWGFTVFF